MVDLQAFFNSRKVRTWHRWVSIIVALYVVMATVSGIIHIIMANFYSPPPPVIPQGLVNIESASLPLAKIVKKIPKDEQVKAINIRTIDNALWYQIVTDKGQPYYINAATGTINANMDEYYAKQIAAAYVKTEALTKTDYVTSFNNEYLNIFRALPVYRFDTSNNRGERVYVSTITGSVTLYLNTARAFGQQTFSALHKFSFIPNKIVRDILMTALVMGILFTTFIGIGIFFARKKKK